MLGLPGSGKTTLLYKLKLMDKVSGEWKDISKLVEAIKSPNGQGDVSYHYEELSSKMLKNYGIWDVPGSLISVWPTFYRYIRISAAIFVVDASKEASENEKSLRDARRVLNFLLNEDELRQAAFIVIINERSETTKNKKSQKKEGEKKNAEKDEGRESRTLSSQGSASTHVEDVAGGDRNSTSSSKPPANSMLGAAAHVVSDKKKTAEQPISPYGDAVQKKLNIEKLLQDEWNQQRMRCIYLDVTDPKQRWETVTEQIHRINIVMGNEA